MADLVDAPWPPVPFRTDRLTIRTTRAEDRAAMIDLLTSAEVRRYLGGPRSRAELERTAPAVPGNYPGIFAVALDRRFIGSVRLDRREPEQPGHLRPAGHELEVSYSFLPEHWGHGYAAEAVSAVLGWAARQLADRDVILCTQVANERSLRLAGRLGFTEVRRFEHLGNLQWLGSRALAPDGPEPGPGSSGQDQTPRIQTTAGE